MIDHLPYCIRARRYIEVDGVGVESSSIVSSCGDAAGIGTLVARVNTRPTSGCFLTRMSVNEEVLKPWRLSSLEERRSGPAGPSKPEATVLNAE